MQGDFRVIFTFYHLELCRVIFRVIFTFIWIMQGDFRVIFTFYHLDYAG